jgi:hypothetical protein
VGDFGLGSRVGLQLPPLLHPPGLVKRFCLSFSGLFNKNLLILCLVFTKLPALLYVPSTASTLATSNNLTC